MASIRSLLPAQLAAAVSDRLLSHITVDATWAEQVRELDRRGQVVYVLKNLSLVDFVALDYVTRRLDLPEIRFANDLGLGFFQPGRSGLASLFRRSEQAETEHLAKALAEPGGSAALFLKRPPHLFEQGARGRKDNDELLHALLDLQRKSKEPILLVPQVFIWSRSPDSKERGLQDLLFGPREWPGTLRTVTQFLMNYRHVALRAGDPVDLQAFLAHEGPGSSDETLVRRLVYTLLRRIERERRQVLGPVGKPKDRVRDEVLRSPKLSKTIKDLATRGGKDEAALVGDASAMLEELQADLDMNAMNALDTVFDATLARMYAGIEVDQEGLERLRGFAREGTLVLLPSHKSHADYIILSRVFYRADMPVPIIAAGDNLNFVPIGPILRKAGAFFIRRSFAGDKLYGAVVDAYIRRLILDGRALEFYLEGGRSRTGKLLAPKLGLLSMVVDAALSVDRPVFFCPISIAYERFVEERAYARELSGGEKQKEDALGLLSAAETIFGRYGRVSIQFGRPMSLSEVRQSVTGSDAGALTPTERRRVISQLSHRVMREINAVTAVTPGALVALVLLGNERRGMPHAELMRRAHWFARRLEGEGARFSPRLSAAGAHGLREDAVLEACQMHISAGHVIAQRPSQREAKGHGHAGSGAIYRVPDDGRVFLSLAKNTLVHFLVERGLIALSLLAARAPVLPLPTLLSDTLFLSKLFKFEFAFRSDAQLEVTVRGVLGAMGSDQELQLEGDMVHLPTDTGALGRYARALGEFVDGYLVAIRTARSLERPTASKEYLRRCLRTGDQMFLTGEIDRRESLSKPLMETALLSLLELGAVARTGDDLRCDDANAGRELEERLLAFTPS